MSTDMGAQAASLQSGCGCLMTEHGQDDDAVITMSNDDGEGTYIEEQSGYPQESQRILHGSYSSQDSLCFADFQRPLSPTVLDTTKLWDDFHRAVQGEEVSVIKALLSAAAMEQPDTMLAEMLTYRRYSKTPLLVATKMRDVGACRSILVKACELGVDLRTILFATEDFGWTCAHDAAYSSESKICGLIWDAAEKKGLLLELLQVKDECGWTVCHCVANSGNVELLEVLTMHVAEADQPDMFLACNKIGHMPVHCAALKGKFAMCEKILEVAWPEDREMMLDTHVDGRTLRALLKEEGYEHDELPAFSDEEMSLVERSFVPEQLLAERSFLPRLYASVINRLLPIPSGSAAVCFAALLAPRILLSICSLLLRHLEVVARQCGRLAAWLSHSLWSRKPIRFALLIGQRHYQKPWKGLRCTWRDVEKLDEVLQHRCGFQVTIMHDATRSWLEGLGPLLAQNLHGQPGGVLMLHYAGHAISCNGETYLVPTDAKSQDPSQCVSLNKILKDAHDIAGGAEGSIERAARKSSAKAAKGSTIFVVVDGCLERVSFDGGTPCRPNRITEARPPRPVNTSVCILYACDLGEKAHEDGEHGIFSKAFIEALQTSWLPWFKVWEKTRALCLKYASEQNQTQRPWNTDSLAAQDLVLNNSCPLL